MKHQQETYKFLKLHKCPKRWIFNVFFSFSRFSNVSLRTTEQNQNLRLYAFERHKQRIDRSKLKSNRILLQKKKRKTTKLSIDSTRFDVSHCNLHQNNSNDFRYWRFHRSIHWFASNYFGDDVSFVLNKHNERAFVDNPVKILW